MRYRKLVFALLLTTCVVLIPNGKQNFMIGEHSETGAFTFSKAIYLDPIPDRLFTIVPEDIPIKTYFKFLNKVIAHYDTLVPYALSEHLLVRANAWIIDSLQNTDYYRRKSRGDTLLVQPDAIIFHQGDTLFFPDSLTALTLSDKIRHTRIDVNIPEFRLRIFENDKELYAFPIRVGQNRVRYLAEAGREVDLRTKTGSGSVIRTNRYPVFTNPVDGKRFTHTKRDDGVTTLMPQIPWTEVELNGMRYGQMIHPTTNPETLERAYSNGCVGLGEADAWRFYYHSPLGTPVVFRYDLEVVSATGDTVLLPDIYKRGNKKQPVRAVIGVFP